MLLRRITFLVVLGVAAAACGVAKADEGRFDKFVVITIDTLRADNLGCYGYGRPVSPEIDAFAAKAVRFEWAFSAAPSTWPSMYAMHTSRYAGLGEHLLSNGGSWAPVAPPTIAHTLRGKGFSTAAFVGNFVLREPCGLTTGFDTYNDEYDSRELNRDYPERICSSLEPAAAAWLEKHADGPFFLWMHFQDPHGPYTPPEPFDTRFADADARPRPLPLLKYNGGPGGIPKYQQLSDHRDFAYYKSRYDGEVNFVDTQLGIFFKRLERLGLTKDTVVIITADHGEAFGEHNRFFCHGHAVTPELTHVPLIMRVPGRAPSVQGMPVSLIDIGPTIMDLAGCEIPARFQGRSLMETIAKGGRPDPLFTETSYALAAVEGEHMLVWGQPHFETGRAENKKAHDPESIDFSNAPITLHALADDPLCTSDVKAEAPEWFRYMRGVCQEYLRLSAKHKPSGEALAIDDETRRALQALGYLSE